MRAAFALLLALSLPSSAWALPRLSDVSLEGGEEQVRLIVALEPASTMPAHLLVPDDLSLRLRLARVATEAATVRLDDQTLVRVRVASLPGRAIVRMDPASARIQDLLERTTVEPHPRGLAVVIRRSPAEVARYREDHGLPPLEPPAPLESSAPEESVQPAAPSLSLSTPAAAAMDTNGTGDDAPSVGGSTATTRDQSMGRASAEPLAPLSGSTVASDWPGSGTRSVLAVLFLLALAGGAWWVRRRRGRGRSLGAVPAIDVVAAKRIGHRQSLLLVEVGGQTLLLGATEQGMVRLADLNEQGGQLHDGTMASGVAAAAAVQAFEAAKPDQTADSTPDDLPNGLSRSRLAELERELKAGPEDIDDPPPALHAPVGREKVSFESSLTAALAETAAWSSGASISSAPAAPPDQSTTSGDRPIQMKGLESSEAVAGLLRLRSHFNQASQQSSIDEVAPPHHGANGKSNGKEMSLAALESLLVSRQSQ
jgi:flagellar biogenesis protein FliO